MKKIGLIILATFILSCGKTKTAESKTSEVREIDIDSIKTENIPIARICNPCP